MSKTSAPLAFDPNTHPIVDPDTWLTARKKLLTEEKSLLHQLDEVNRQRRELPWVKVGTDYVFEGPSGKQTLGDLFRGRSQLIIYHFMFGPGWQEGCSGCSFLCDHVAGARMHFEHHDVAFAAVSRAPWQEFQSFQKRMGWSFPWLSSHGTPFNFDFSVSFTPEQIAAGKAVYNYGPMTGDYEELHGISVFYRKPDGSIFHTYSSYSRGGDLLIGALQFLDLTPKGRNETTTMDWMRHHDKYEQTKASCCCS